jgi:hypothetical protein
MSKCRPSTSNRRDRDRLMHRQWYLGNFIQRRMMDLPEHCRRKLPASEDEGTLLAAERAIREEYAAEMATT